MNPAPFILEKDRVLLELTVSVYTTPLYNYGGFKYRGDLSPPRVKVFESDTQVIIVCRGTSIGKLDGINDIMDDIGLSTGQGCDISIVQEASPIIEQFLSQKEIIVCGHSLGGAAAFCLAEKYPEITRAVSFNGAAPLIGGPHVGPGARGMFYHIVGDVVSTHIEGCEILRIKFDGFVDWGNPIYYHSTDRFFSTDSFDEWTPQEEQDSITAYVYSSTLTSTLVSFVTGVLTKYLHRDRLRELVCSNPIPGSNPSGECLEDRSIPYYTDRILGTFAGGALGFILGGGVPGAIVGARTGYDLTTGEGVLDIFGPTKVLKKIRRGGKMYVS